MSRPFWAPLTTRLNAWSDVMPNCCMSILTARIDSFRSNPKVSRRVSPFFVICSSLDGSISPVCCLTCAIASATSCIDSPKFWE